MVSSGRDDEVCDPAYGGRYNDSSTAGDIIKNKFTFLMQIQIEKVKLNNLGQNL